MKVASFPKTKLFLKRATTLKDQKVQLLNKLVAIATNPSCNKVKI